MNRSECPICHKKFTDILKHFVLAHDARDMNHLEQLIKEANMKEQEKTDFRDYVTDLQVKLKEGKISPEEYRELIMRWSREH